MQLSWEKVKATELSFYHTCSCRRLQSLYGFPLKSLWTCHLYLQVPCPGWVAFVKKVLSPLPSPTLSPPCPVFSLSSLLLQVQGLRVLGWDAFQRCYCNFLKAEPASSTMYTTF